MAEYFFGITDKGRRREKNEDTFIAKELVKKELVVACVIDGVGGYSGGEVAAAIARSIILRHLQSRPADSVTTLQTAIIAANGKIAEEKKKHNENEQMACVLTCAITDIKNNKLYYAHVGDTRLYLLRDRSLVKLSKDHSVVGFLEESGRLSEEDAMHHPRRNEITKALGFEESIGDISDFIETGESPFLPGVMVLVCSDGLSDMISSDTILTVLLKKNSLAETAAELVAAANDAGGNDNITAVLVQNNKQPVPKVALKPVERKQSQEKNNPDEATGTPGKPSKLPVRRNRSFIALLALFSLALLAMALFQKNPRAKENIIIAKTAAVKPINKNLDLFIQRTGDSSKIYSISPE
jgi:serine/threonine protein phosphatase PrpC